MFKVNYKDIRTTTTVTLLLTLLLTLHILVSLLLTLNIFHILLLCFFCWLWTDNYRPVRYSYHLWLLLVKKSGNSKKKTNMFRRLQIKVLSLPNIIPLFSPPNIGQSNLFFVRIYAQGVLTVFYGILIVLIVFSFQVCFINYIH